MVKTEDDRELDEMARAWAACNRRADREYEQKLAMGVKNMDIDE